MGVSLALLLWDIITEGVSWYVALSDKFVPPNQAEKKANPNWNIETARRLQPLLEKIGK